MELYKQTDPSIYRAPSVPKNAQVLELYAPGSLRETVGAWARNLSRMWGGDMQPRIWGFP